MVPPTTQTLFLGDRQFVMHGATWIFLLLVASGLVGLVACWRIRVNWAAVMETAGFVDVETLIGLDWTRWTLVCALSLGVITCTGAMDFAARDSVSKWSLVTWVLMTASFCGMASTSVLAANHITYPQQLASQAVAVERFNRGVCVAWCHNSADASSLLAMRLCERAPASLPVFNRGNMPVRVALWCQQAILTDAFGANATDVGASPFAALAADPVAGVNRLGYVLALSEALIWSASVSAVVVAINYLVAYWPQSMPRLNKRDVRIAKCACRRS